MTNENNPLIQSTSDLDVKIIDTANQLLTDEDVDLSKDLLSLFNWYLSKKNITRVLKLNDLYDSVTDQMVERFNSKTDQFTNSDLLDYMKAVQSAIDTSGKNLTQVQDPPTIVQQHNTQVNINVVDTFDKDSKARILAAVQATIARAKNQTSNEVNTEDKEDVSKTIEIQLNDDDTKN